MRGILLKMLNAVNYQQPCPKTTAADLASIAFRLLFSRISFCQTGYSHSVIVCVAPAGKDRMPEAEPVRPIDNNHNEPDKQRLTTLQLATVLAASLCDMGIAAFVCEPSGDTAVQI